MKGNGAGAGNRKEVQGEQETGFWVRELNQSVDWGLGSGGMRRLVLK